MVDVVVAATMQHVHTLFHTTRVDMVRHGHGKTSSRIECTMYIDGCDWHAASWPTCT